MSKRAAVVIGVGTTGTLPPLKSPVPQAKAVAKWLAGEDFEVTVLTDETTKVDARSIADAIDKYVKPPTRYSMLVVYFSGHGIFHARSDVWLLSEAPGRPDEAINLTGAIDLARGSGIPNVVLISDACRSLPQDLGGALVSGGIAFPFYPGLGRSKVDVFRATLPAKVAYEIQKRDGDQAIESLLTTAWLSAYDNPPADMQKSLTVAGNTIIVVPNRKLEAYLQDEVDHMLDDLGQDLDQSIEADVPSDDDVYIGRARIGAGQANPLPPPATGNGDEGPKPGVPRGRRTASEGKLAAVLVRERLVAGTGGIALDRPLVAKETRTSVEGQIAARLPTDAVTHFETETGFVVYGPPIKRAGPGKREGRPGAEVLVAGGHGEPGLIRVWNVKPAATIAVEFSDGRSAALAALFGYIGHCTVGPDGLSNISYVPSSNHPRWGDYMKRRGVIDQLRAEVAVAADHNTFSLSSPEKAESFGRLIRQDKALDPTLGLYAAYAYTQAGNEDEVRNVLEFMWYDLHADLFDVRMLAFRRPPAEKRRPVVPACPMLTQGWNLIAPRQVELPQGFAEGAGHLTGSLWTTFEPPFAGRLFATIERGDF
ncbi:caspase family protein [Taklimakanibacter deserti]|uniref:caspase family protein n=1 Tax=Taklimakanibacter deserti TaxID=2267839 RepID=UPI000E654EC1